MNRNRKLARAAASALAVFGLATAANAAIVYSDNFERTTPNGGAYTYATTVTAGDGGAVTDGSIGNSSAGQLALTNDISSATNANGITYLWTPTSAYAATFNPSLNSNVGNILTWSLNIQQFRSNPSGLAAGNYGTAYVLGATDSNFATVGSGYAIVIGNTGTLDPVRLIKFANGLAPVGTGASTAAFNLAASSLHAGSDYQSVRVSYDPAGNDWKLYVRDDGVTGFQDATTGDIPLVAIANDTTFTNVALTHSGFYWAYSTTGSQTARFDNVQLDVGVPEPASGLAALALAATCVARRRPSRRG
ncbi:MAG TPA: hypothetical protein VF669_10545 [Tepidisphaeraceae bacterium]|jgi:hypothetical protein